MPSLPPPPPLGGIESSCWGRKSGAEEGKGKGRGKKEGKQRRKEGKGKREGKRGKGSEREENMRGREKVIMKGKGMGRVGKEIKLVTSYLLSLNYTFINSLCGASL